VQPQNYKRKQAQVFMVNDITEMLPPPETIEEESDAESEDSQKSSQSYLEGTDIYKTSLPFPPPPPPLCPHSSTQGSS
jgi:hypothetical protein